MKYYTIADLHGRFDLLEKARCKIKEVSQPEDKVVFLGDYIDRGPQSREVIEHLMEASRLGEVICLQGNHEAMAVECITHNLQTDWWVGNGGDATFASYGWGGPPYNQLMYEMMPKEHYEWLKALPLYFQTEKQIFVHAGMPQWDMNVPPSNTTKGERLRQQMQWMLYDSRESGGWKGKHVVHGHHQSIIHPTQWLDPKKGGRTNLDTYAWNTGRLVIGVFDDTQLHAKEFIEIEVDTHTNT